MSMITLKNASQTNCTVLSNHFIDQYMPAANGEFVKVYIYLLRVLTASPDKLSLEQMADHLLCTEKDISRALFYWEKMGLVTLSYTASKELCGITLCEGSSPAMPSDRRIDHTDSAPAPASSVRSLTPDRVSELQKDQKIAQLLFITEQYLGKTLRPTEVQKLLFFYDELKMSPELIEYLIEYCVSKNKKSFYYIESVALAWAKDQITTVEMAREASTKYAKEYYTILKALGISGRDPVEKEISFMDIWLHKYAFSLPLIQEACNRTILRTKSAPFPYVDKILSDWKQKNVVSLEDVHRLDLEHQQKKQKKTPAEPAKNNSSNSKNRFNNFKQREYDFEEYEKRLLNQ